MTTAVGSSAYAVAAATPVTAAAPMAAAGKVTAVKPWATVEAGSTTPVTTAISVAAPATAKAQVGTCADRTVESRGNAAGDHRRGQTDPDVHATGLGGGGIEAGANANHGGKGQSCKCSHGGLLLEK
jgi:hypothetical protein